MDINNKKVLLVGLGILGGGLSMAKYLLRNGAKLTITDLRDKKTLQSMIKRLPASVKYTLEKHKREDFVKADIVIFNPAVSILSPWAKLTKNLKKPFYNDYTFFLDYLAEKNPSVEIIGTTGTRGKTTVSLWVNQLVDDSTLGGNIPEKGLLKIMSKKTNCFVLELSSFQLEYSTKNTPAPKIAILTNIYNDHLNRYGKFDVYAKMKFKIFENQNKDDYLILNADEDITKEVLKLKPKAKIYYVSDKKLPHTKNGLYFMENDLFLNEHGKTTKIATLKGYSRHERANLLCAMMAAHLSGVAWENILKKVPYLINAPLRQETILKTNRLSVINDSAATSPDAVVAAIEKHNTDEDFVLIIGGTDKNLDYTILAKKIKSSVPPKNLYFLSGSGTDKLKKELHLIGYPLKGTSSGLKSYKLAEFESLEDLVKTVAVNHKSGTIVFSPGGSSFEKFKNEFDRGAKFTKYVTKYF